MMYRDIRTWVCLAACIYFIALGVCTIEPRIGLVPFFGAGYFLGRARGYWNLGKFKEDDK